MARQSIITRSRCPYPESSKNRWDEGQTLYNLGNVFKEWGQYDKAVEYYKKSLAIKRELKDRTGEGRCLGTLGLVFQHRGDYGSALENFQRDSPYGLRSKCHRAA